MPNNFFQYFPSMFTQKLRNLECSTQLILVNCFLKSSQNSLQHSANLIFVAICGGFSPFWSQIDWTICDIIVRTNYRVLVKYIYLSLTQESVIPKDTINALIYWRHDHHCVNQHQIISSRTFWWTVRLTIWQAQFPVPYIQTSLYSHIILTS